MCGIVGYIGPRGSTEILLTGLSRLEYRGYDSAGIAVLTEAGLETRRAEGKLKNLVDVVTASPIDGQVGIGHTRWATHGRPSETNAHPHRFGSVAVVHNGIIENHLELKNLLIEAGHVFESETDTEIIAHLVGRNRANGQDLVDAVRSAALELHGAFSIVVMDSTTPDTIVGVRVASPLVLGVGSHENFIASDVPAILDHTRDVVFLEEGSCAVVKADSYRVFDLQSGDEHETKVKRITWTPAMAEKGGYKHFMLKEIHEQPQAIADTLMGRISLERLTIEIPEVSLDADALANISQFYVVACGTSWHAGLVGKYFFEDLAGLATHVELASELRYRNAPMDDRTLFLAISQSGETADTLAAIRHAKQQGAKIISICNVLESSIPRESHGTIYTHAGPEIGVASTKAFTTQIVALHLLALRFGRLLGRIDDETMAAELDGLTRLAAIIDKMLEDNDIYHEVARAWLDCQSMLYLGRGNLFPLALEGALKLKEISYIHAEGYAAGEMKHGPIALIEEKVPTVVLNPRDRHYAKVKSNKTEVKARSGPVLVIATEGDDEAKLDSDYVITIPAVPEHLLPIVAAIPMQLIAYYMADHKGTDVDQPRNLAKSVTVE